MPKYGEFSCLYFPVFGLNIERYSYLSVFSPNAGKYGPSKNSVFGHYSRSSWVNNDHDSRFRVLYSVKSIVMVFGHRYKNWVIQFCFFIFFWTPEVFRLNSVLKNFTKLTRKHLLQSLFLNGVLGHATLLKKRLWHRCLPVNFAKTLKTPVLKNICEWLFL